jgi:hypothetical protein
MKTNAKQTGKLMGTTSWMVLGILILTVLPLNTIGAGNFEKSDCHSLTTSTIAIEPWMLSLTDWNAENSVVENDETVNIESWMMAPEYWNGQTEFAEVSATDLESLDVWMFEPEGWNCDLAGLRLGVADRDLVMIPLYF